ncbi:ribonuclease H-like domain-containing protein [Tanacetum coccineum]
MFLSQRKYAAKILERAIWLIAISVGLLLILSLPVCLNIHDPREPHFSALKWILSAEAEYRGIANDVVETCWLRNLLRQLHNPLSLVTLVYCDNVSDVYLSLNPV